MGNKNSGELWESVYKLQHKEFLAFNDMLTEKIQMGELDSSDKKAIQKAKDDFHASIAADRTKLHEAIWMTYADKGKMGQSEVRSIVKDALTHGKTHLPPVLVALVEVEAMRSPEVQKQSSGLMTDREARPLLEKSLARIRKDCGERVSNSLNELLSDVNTIGDKLLLRLTIPADTKDVKEAKLDPKALVKQETFMKLFHAANQDAIGMKELIQSVLAQFTNFLEIELRNIPERVIKKLEADEEERERVATAENPKKA